MVVEKYNKYVEKWDSAVAQYLKEQKYKGIAEKSLKNYTAMLNLFRRWWNEQNPKDDPTAKDFESWRNALLDSGKKPSTVKQYLSQVEFFYNYACDTTLPGGALYSENPISKRLMPKVKKRAYDEILNDEQVEKLWCRKNYTNVRNYAIVVMLLCTKIRNSELAALTMRDVDFENGEIRILHGKGDKMRVVEFDETAQAALQLYLQKGNRPSDLPDDAPLFGNTSEQGVFGGMSAQAAEWHPYTSQGLSALVERQIKKITGIENIRTHDLRHIGSRIALNSRTVSLEELQAELGHSSMNTTQIYSGRLVLGKRNKESVQRLLEEKRLQTEQNEQYLERIGKRG